MFKTMLIVKESRQNEKRVALIPGDVKQFVKKGYNVLVEENAGLASGYSNNEYQCNGAQIVNWGSNSKMQLPRDLLILRVKRGSRERESWEFKCFSENTYMMGFLDPLANEDIHVEEWQNAGITTFSLEQLKLNSDNPKNVSSVMSKIAGRLAFDDGDANYTGDIRPKIIIIGTGIAALAATAQALDKYSSVLVLGRNEKHRTKFTQISSGIEYITMPENNTSETQINFIQPYLTEPCVVVSAARVLGAKSPVLINKTTIAKMSKGSVIVDLAGEGGNVEHGPRDQRIVTDNGILLLNVSGYPKKEPRLASQLYSEGLSKLILEFISRKMDLSDDLLAQSYITSAGKRNINLFGAEPAGLSPK